MYTPKIEELIELGFVVDGDIFTRKVNDNISVHYDENIEEGYKFYGTEPEGEKILSVDSIEDLSILIKALDKIN